MRQLDMIEGTQYHILNKPGRLNEEDFGMMKTHVNKGLDIIERSGWLKDAMAVVSGHHEKMGVIGA